MNWADIERLFEQYGYFVLPTGLFFEFIALPFPGETTLTYSGYLSYKGVLHWFPVMTVALIGTTLGMTVTYWIGHKAGMPIIARYGKWVLLTPHKIEKTRNWFTKYGTKLLFIGYFIPGVRHFTGYFSGIIRIPFRKLALYTYTGAAFWVVCFICLGYGFGPQWRKVFHLMETNAWKFVVAVCGLLILYGAFRLIICLRKVPATDRLHPPSGKAADTKISENDPGK